MKRYLLFFRYLIIIISFVLTFSGCLSYGNCSSSEAFSLTSSSCIKCDKRQVDLSMKYVKQAFHPSVIRVCLESAISNLKCVVKWNPIRSVPTVAEDKPIYCIVWPLIRFFGTEIWNLALKRSSFVQEVIFHEWSIYWGTRMKVGWFGKLSILLTVVVVNWLFEGSREVVSRRKMFRMLRDYIPYSMGWNGDQIKGGFEMLYINK